MDAQLSSERFRPGRNFRLQTVDGVLESASHDVAPLSTPRGVHAAASITSGASTFVSPAAGGHFSHCGRKISARFSSAAPATVREEPSEVGLESRYRLYALLYREKIDAAHRAPVSPRDSRSPRRERDGYAQRCRLAAEAGKPRHELLHQERRKVVAEQQHVAGEGSHERDTSAPLVSAVDAKDLRSLPYCGPLHVEEKQQADHLMRLFEEFLETEDGQLYSQAREAKLHQRRQSPERSPERPGQRQRCGLGSSKVGARTVVVSDSAPNSPVLAMRKAEAARYRKYVEERKQALFRKIAQEILPVTRVRDTKIEKFPLWRVQDRIACDQVVMHRRQPKM
mmetsp:Transcript_33782/g.71622  ORF Transcript_33782/g.71622 Transcript_33782/m.71622 type:complete len:339 (-) Transcript_33782:228-1244(-)